VRLRAQAAAGFHTPEDIPFSAAAEVTKDTNPSNFYIKRWPGPTGETMYL
jgi:hypothetical protein